MAGVWFLLAICYSVFFLCTERHHQNDFQFVLAWF
jgi:hypothetical protein